MCDIVSAMMTHSKHCEFYVFLAAIQFPNKCFTFVTDNIRNEKFAATRFHSAQLVSLHLLLRLMKAQGKIRQKHQRRHFQHE